MTTEEKAKAYDEALKKAQCWLSDPQAIQDFDFTLEDTIQNIFPQLRESDDERIRKEIIDYLGLVGKGDGDYAQPMIDRWIAYLEKQKEQKHPNGCFTCDEYKKGYEEGRRNGFTAGYNKAMKEVEQKEQKPIMDKHLAIYLSSVIARDIDRVMDGMCMSSMECVALENAFLKGDFDEVSKFLEKKYTATTKAEQKPVEIHNPTDEEVESWENELTEFKKFATKQAKENQLHISYTRDIMWENFCSELLSFVNSRKPAEWSEEDTLMLTAIIQTLERFGGRGTTGMQIDWLKSLRPYKK